jgi:transposase-like protein
MNRTRRSFTAEQKAAVVRRHLAGKEPVSALAEELEVQPSQIHTWVNQVLVQAEKAFERTPQHRRSEQAKNRQIERLLAKLVDKNEVIAELIEANLRATKVNGEALNGLVK